jgi:poly(3-hydroxybutyrate) depolymerase
MVFFCLDKSIVYPATFISVRRHSEKKDVKKDGKCLSRIFLGLAVATLILSCTGVVSSSDTNSPTPTPSPTISVRSNQTISGHSHTFDMYIPSNAQSAVIFLHGGGGRKEGVANSLGIKNDSTSSNYSVSPSGESWLIANKVMFVFPQGQHVIGQPLATTWSNYVMDSGEDDVAFLQDLVAALQADSSLSAINKYYLAGHSNGGMMANRMWCESPNTFAAYGALSGPPSTQLDAAGLHPCNPSSVKPFLAIVGDNDLQLQTAGNMGAATWSLSDYNGSSAAWVSSTVLNDLLYFSNRVSAKCGGSVSGPVVSGQLSIYSGCSNDLEQIIVNQTVVSGTTSGGGHCLVTSGSCAVTLAPITDFDYKSVLFDFLKQF